MKTKINQAITVIGFFTSTIAATLFISWGMTSVVFSQTAAVDSSIETIEKNIQVEVKNNMKNAFKLLIPKINR